MCCLVSVLRVVGCLFVVVGLLLCVRLFCVCVVVACRCRCSVRVVIVVGVVYVMVDVACGYYLVWCVIVGFTSCCCFMGSCCCCVLL